MRKNNIFLVFSKILLITALLYFIKVIAVETVTNAVAWNSRGIPSKYLNAFTTTMNGNQPTGRANYGYCPIGDVKNKYTYYGAWQKDWLSQINDPTAESASITDQQNTLDLRYNILSAVCNANLTGWWKDNRYHYYPEVTSEAPYNNLSSAQITGNTAGKWLTQNLKATQWNVKSVTASIYNLNTGVSYALTPSMLGDGVNLKIDYNTAYWFNLRFAKRPYGEPDEPIYKQLRLSGFNAAPVGNYELRVSVRSVVVHHFQTTNSSGGINNIYQCVNDLQKFTNDLLDTKPAPCSQSLAVVKAPLEILPNPGAICEIIGAPSIMQPGETKSGLKIKVTNIGSPLLSGQYQIYDRIGTGLSDSASLPANDPTRHSNTFWNAVQSPDPSPQAGGGARGPARLRIFSSENSTAQLANDASIESPPFSITMPNNIAGNEIPLAFHLIREGAGADPVQHPDNGGGWYKNPGSICQTFIKVATNEPYLNIQGGDVKSGASFKNAEVCKATEKAAWSANIQTSGYYKNTANLEMDGTLGSSVSQYSVFASGFIASQYGNNFYGNNGYFRSSLGKIRDGLFANERVDNPDSDYGYFYANDSQLPCVDVSKELKESPNDTADTSSFVENGSGVLRVNGDKVISATNITGNKTLVVDGNVTISPPLTYKSGYSGANDVPYLKIIAKNIFIEASTLGNPQVIDGHLFAIPTISGATQNDGIIDTCSNMGGGSAGQWPTAMTTGSCKRADPSLKINGSLTARRILWKRTNGTVGAPNEVIDNSCARRDSECAAEFINFSPEAYIANMGAGGGNVSSVPISTQELPPIY